MVTSKGISRTPSVWPRNLEWSGRARRCTRGLVRRREGGTRQGGQGRGIREGAGGAKAVIPVVIAGGNPRWPEKTKAAEP